MGDDIHTGPSGRDEDLPGLRSKPHSRMVADEETGYRSNDRIAQTEKIRAQQLARVVESFRARVRDGAMTKAQAERIACEEIRRSFGKSWSPRNFRRHLARFERQEAEIRRAETGAKVSGMPGPAKDSHQNPTVPPERAIVEPHEMAREIRDGFMAPGNPSDAEKAWLWHRCFEECERGGASRGTKTLFVEAIREVLGGTISATRELWRRYHLRWSSGGKSPTSIFPDVRPSREHPIPEEDEKALLTIIIHECEGRMEQGWRIAWKRKALSEGTMRRFNGKRLPHSVARQIRHKIPELKALHQGPRNYTLSSAFCLREWTTCNAGDWYQGDDATLPVYYWDPSVGPETLWRGQCLFMIDVRSRKILDFILVTARQYNSLDIRRLMTRTCLRFGLPARGFYFERGIWKKARLVKGVGRSLSDLSDVEVESGFQSLGMEFRHAVFPRSKSIERVIGMLQNRMGGVPGYVGRNEQVVKFERIQRSKLDVLAGRAHPGKHFLSAQEWVSKLNSICEEHNEEVQRRRSSIKGLTPNEAWIRLRSTSRGQSDVSTEAEMRRLLCTHIRPVTIGRNGVQFEEAGELFVYRGEGIALRRGEKVLAWFNVVSPEFCTVTDMNRKNPVVLERAEAIPAMDATSDDFANAQASIRSLTRPAMQYYSSITPEKPELRTHIPNPEISQDCLSEEAQRDAIKTRRKNTSRRVTEAKAAIQRVLPTGEGAELARTLSGNPRAHAHFMDTVSGLEEMEREEPV